MQLPSISSEFIPNVIFPFVKIKSVNENTTWIEWNISSEVKLTEIIQRWYHYKKQDYIKINPTWNIPAVHS